MCKFLGRRSASNLVVFGMHMWIVSGPWEKYRAKVLPSNSDLSLEVLYCCVAHWQGCKLNLRVQTSWQGNGSCEPRSADSRRVLPRCVLPSVCALVYASGSETERVVSLVFTIDINRYILHFSDPVPVDVNVLRR